MTSKHIKRQLLYYLIYERNIPAITEGTFLGIADVLGIKDMKYVMEFEVKCSKADLKGELDTIDWLYHGTRKENNRYPKLWKHALMHDAFVLHNISPASYRKSPNYFAFVVPHELTEYALSRLEGTPYGLLEAQGWGIKSVKKNQIIHEERVLDLAFYRIMMKGAYAHYQQIKDV